MNKETTIYLQGALGVKQDADIGPITRKAYADKLLSIALKEVGIFETSQNHGEGIEKYWKACDYSDGYKDRAPYCAAFISYLFFMAGVFNEDNRPRTASAFAFEAWGRKVGLNVTRPPKNVKKGDLVILSISHIGIASSDSDSKGNFSTVEANTSSGSKGSQRDGGGVFKRTRNISCLRSVVRL